MAEEKPKPKGKKRGQGAPYAVIDTKDHYPYPATPKDLTPEQEEYAELLLFYGDPVKAFRMSHPDMCAKLTAGAASFRAIALMKSAGMRDRIEEKREALRKSGGYTLEQHVEELERIQRAATEAGQFHVAGRMAELRGKALGFQADKVIHSGTVEHKHSGIEITFVEPK